MPREYKSFPRVFVAAALRAGSPVELYREQANHLVTVLRLKEGDSAILFNGRDGAWLARLTHAGKKSAILDIVVQTAHQTPASDLWFGFAPLKTGRLDYLIQKATEMGAGVIQPVITEYTQIRRLKDDKLEAYALEAAQQCEVLSVPAIAPEVDLRSLVETWRGAQGLRRLLLADEPTGNLDPTTSGFVFDGLTKLVRASKLAALIATHNHDLAARMDRRITLRDGKVVEIKSPPTLRAIPGAGGEPPTGEDRGRGSGGQG